ncbi:aminopeptidase N [Sinomonas halotolerans]|uniref:Aminopeptidase N n=1 Tax=Sinomonas halotolerans TaxID=1644133 RepID=A0ABU9X1K8_9MICC
MPTVNQNTPNLTRDEAAERGRLVEVESYHVALDLRGAEDPSATSFRSSSVIEFTATPGAATWVDFLGEAVMEVRLNGRILDEAMVHDGARIRLAGLAERNRVEITARALYSTSGEGLHRFTDPADGRTYLYTQCEPADARRFFPCFEQPDLKARISFTVLAPQGWHVSANGAAVSEDPVSTEDGLPAGVRWEFAPTPPMSSYLAAVIAGPYHRVVDAWTSPDGGRSVPLAAYCRASLAEHFDAERIFALTKAGLDFFDRTFGEAGGGVAYPWGKYEQTFVPEYNLGAMENPGLVTFTEQYVFTSRAADSQYEGRANTLMHEMAHMWFGDLVTMRWWDDLWLKESFADFMGTFAVDRATDWNTAWVNFANRRKAWAYLQDQLPTTHPVIADIADLEAAEQNFDGITYAKGASVLKQLVAYVGEEAFFAAAREYFRDNAYGNAALADLLRALEAAQEPGQRRDLGAWAAAWLCTSGLSVLEPVVESEGGRLTRVAVRQTAVDPVTGRAALRPHRLRVGLFSHDGDGRLVRTASADVEVDGELTEVPGLAGRAAPELVLVNDEDLTYAKVRLDTASERTVREGLGDIADPLARALCWTALWHAARDGETPAERYVDAVERFATAETTVGVQLAVLDNARTAIERYTHGEARASLRSRYLAAVVRELRAAAPGSDQQLAWARALAAGSRYGGGQLGLVRGLLEGTETVRGLAVDQDLRWSLLQALAAQGQADAAELDAELGRDRTAKGRVGHTVALAARPRAEAKRAAWESAVGDESLSNELLGATVEGFMCGLEALRQPYTERYFALLRDVWSERSQELATRIVTGLYPADATLAWDQAPEENPVLVRTDEWLADNADVPAALRRLVVEARDHLHRALRAQDRSRAG